MIPKIMYWLCVDFSSLRLPRRDFELQTSIDGHRVTMASAAMIFFGLDPGKFVHWMAGEYTGNTRDVPATLAALNGHVSTSDYEHIRRILMQGCPAKLQFDKSSTNKLAILKRGNQKSVTDYLDIVSKTLNKEDWYSHIILMDH